MDVDVDTGRAEPGGLVALFGAAVGCEVDEVWAQRADAGDSLLDDETEDSGAWRVFWPTIETC